MEYCSPLRYPGGKGKVTNFIKLVIQENHLLGGTYIEPFAGGGSVALGLLFSEFVSKIIINDLDRSIYAFWHSVLNDTKQLIQKIEDCQVTVGEWKKQKAIQEVKTDVDLLQLGFSTFFLNRANRSGIIEGGIIGGKNQTGKWKIDARFNKKSLIERIKRIKRYRNRIQLLNLNAVDLIETYKNSIPPKSLTYFDPPYFVKGKDLYQNHFKPTDHEILANGIKNIGDFPWIVSYDNVPEICNLYSEYESISYSINYSAAEHTKGTEIMVFSNGLSFPRIKTPTKVEKSAIWG